MFRTLSRSLMLSAVVAGALFAQLPPVPAPPENPITAEKAVLGKILFWDEQLSSDNTTACGTCHISEVGGGDPRASTPGNIHPGPDGMFATSDDIRGSRGVVHCAPSGDFTPEPHFFPRPQVTARKSPSFIGVQWADELFWDGRASGTFVDPETNQIAIAWGGALESQAAGPQVSSVEMACSTRSYGEINAKLLSVLPLRLAQNLPADVAAALAQYPTYPDLFQAAFGDPTINAVRIAKAIATYERTLVPDGTPFDDYMNGNPAAMTPQQILGMNLFNSTANCAQCHVAPLFTDNSFANIGVRPALEDIGREQVTAFPPDRGAFRVPSLRNSGLRAPFFHNGGKQTMLDVVLFYQIGGDFPNQATLDPRLVPVPMTHSERVAVADFVENALTDPRVALAQYPFDRPMLRSELASYVSDFGTAKSGLGGIVPRHVTTSEPYLGNAQFRVGLSGALGGAPAYFVLADTPAVPGTAFNTIPLNVDPASAFILAIPTTLSGASGVAGAGYASVGLPIPLNPALDDLTLYFQWLVVDPSVSDYISTTKGLMVTTFTP